MKIRSIVLPTLLAALTFLFYNCGGKKESSHEGHGAKDTVEHVSKTEGYAQAVGPQFSVDAKFQSQLAGVFSSYVSLKDAFVASDPAKVKSESSSTEASLGKVDMMLLSGSAHNDWMNYLSGLKGSLQSIQASADIEEQRKAFSDLSDNMYKTIKAYGLGGVDAYYEFCPMAFDNQGAYWLSSEDKIRNPYFGEKMLTCGEVKEKLK